MKKFKILVFTIMLSLTFITFNKVDAFTVTNNCSQPDEQYNYNNDGLNDLKFTCSSIASTEIVLYTPEFVDDNTYTVTEFISNSAVSFTLNNVFGAGGVPVVLDLSLYTNDTIDTINIYFVNPIVHIYDSIGYIGHYNDTMVSDDSDFIELIGVMSIASQEDITQARIDGYNSAKDYYEDYYADYNYTQSQFDSAVSTAYDNGYNDGATYEFDALGWLRMTFTFIGALFNIEFLPNLTIGTIAVFWIIVIVVPAILGIVTLKGRSG